HRRLAAGEAGDEPADDRTWRAAGDVGPDVGVVQAQAAGRRVVAVALLRDGQRDDLDGRVGDPLDGRVSGAHLAHRADDPRGCAARVAFEQAVQAVLGAE